MNILTDLTDSNAVVLVQDILSFEGPPEYMTGEIEFQNVSQEDFYITELQIEYEELEELNSIRNDTFQVNAEIEAGQKLLQMVSISLDPSIRPGIVSLGVVIGGVNKSMTLNILRNLSIEIFPPELVLEGISPGKTLQSEITISNEGNVPVSFSLRGQQDNLDIKAIIRCLAGSVKKTAEPAGQNANVALDSFFNNIKEELKRCVNVSFAEKDIYLAPGNSSKVKVMFTLPEIIEERQYFEGEIEILNEKLTYKIFGLQEYNATGNNRKTKK